MLDSVGTQYQGRRAPQTRWLGCIFQITIFGTIELQIFNFWVGGIASCCRFRGRVDRETSGVVPGPAGYNTGTNGDQLWSPTQHINFFPEIPRYLGISEKKLICSLGSSCRRPEVIVFIPDTSLVSFELVCSLV